MAGEQKRKERAALVTKALLLGYEFRWGVFSAKACYLRLPNGNWRAKGMQPIAFPAVHLAAIEALKLSGVHDAAKPSGDTGTGSGKNFRLRGRRRLRGGFGRFLEGSASKS